MWEVENRSPFPHRAGFLRDHNGDTLWCLHVKASFALRPDQSLTFPFPQPALLQGPLYDGPRLLAEAEIGQPRPLCDLILQGHATPPPDARRETGWRIEARLAGWRKAVHVRPAMVWQNGRAIPVPAAQAVAPVALDWRAAYGGPEFAENPIGSGHITADGTQLPRLAPEGTSPDARRFAPISYAAIPREWPQRARLGGTYDDAWLRRRSPLLPTDLSPAYWQATPKDQWLDPVSLPGSTLEISGVGPRPFAVGVPDCDLEIATRFRGAWHQQTPRLQSVTFDLDTQQLSLLWLATFPIGAAQHDVLVDRSFVALRKSRGFSLPAADMPAFLTPWEAS